LSFDLRQQRPKPIWVRRYKTPKEPNIDEFSYPAISNIVDSIEKYLPDAFSQDNQGRKRYYTAKGLVVTGTRTLHMRIIASILCPNTFNWDVI